MKLVLAVLTVTMTAACVPPTEAPPTRGNELVAVTSNEMAQGNAIVEAGQSDITGEYVVTHVDGATPIINIKGYDPTVTISKERIHFQSQCIYNDWTYQRDGENISTVPYHGPDIEMCARGLAPGETAIQDAFKGARTVRRIRGGLFIEGGGHQLQLRRVLDTGSLAGRAVDLAGAWHIVSVDGKDLERSNWIAVSADHEQIWWEPECAAQQVQYTMRGSRFEVLPAGPVSSAVCDIAFPAELTRTWSAMEAADTIGLTQANDVLISGNGRRVTLRRDRSGPGGR